jgi:hypothetical protein
LRVCWELERREREMNAITPETAAEKTARHAAIRAALNAGLDAGMHDPVYDVDSERVYESIRLDARDVPVTSISVDDLTTADPDLDYRGESDPRFAPCQICCVHTAHPTVVCADCRPRVLARLAYEASRVNAPNALQLSHAAADAFAASTA